MSEAWEIVEKACDKLKCGMKSLDDNRDDESYKKVMSTLWHITYMAIELIDNPLEPDNETCD